MQRIRGVLDADAAEWGLSQRWVAALVAAPIVLGAVAVLAIPFRSAFRVLANEDGLIEWGQVVLAVSLIVVYAAIAVTLWRSGRRTWAALFGVAALGMLFISGEEISWGQRIFGWDTPDDLDDVNNQGETNLHNVGLILPAFNLMIMGVSAAAIVLPLARWTVWRDRARTLPGYLLVAPLALVPAFLFPFAYRAVRLTVLPEPRYVITKLSEFAELSFYFGLAVFAVLTLRAVRELVRSDAPSRIERHELAPRPGAQP